MSDARPATKPPLPTDAQEVLDLYCLECGYNLRGLSGDPRRCPECGYGNPLSSATIPADIIRRQLRRMETAPTLCLGASLLILPALGMTGWLLLQGETEPLCCCSAPLVFAVVLWLAAAATFKSTCAGAPEWRRALLKCQLYGLLVVVPTGASIILAGSMLVRWSSYGEDLAAFIRFGCIVVPLLAASFVFGRWVHRRIEETLHPLQRETAIRIARQTLVRRMTREQ